MRRRARAGPDMAVGFGDVQRAALPCHHNRALLQIYRDRLAQQLSNPPLARADLRCHSNGIPFVQNLLRDHAATFISARRRRFSTQCEAATLFAPSPLKACSVRPAGLFCTKRQTSWPCPSI